jgi:hypothetical protein
VAVTDREEKIIVTWVGRVLTMQLFAATSLHEQAVDREPQ